MQKKRVSPVRTIPSTILREVANDPEIRIEDAAILLGVPRTSFARRVKELGITWVAGTEKVLAKQGTSVYDYCMNHNLHWILEQWDQEKNTLESTTVSYGSKKHAWWKCTQGHSWQGSIGAKIKYLYHCPYCAGQRIIPGENDFATLFPEAMKQWIPELNQDSPHPSTIKQKHTHMAWWKCDLGHQWQATYASRANGRGCRFCGGKEVIFGTNDLVSIKPETAQCYSEQNVIPIAEVFANDTRTFWWDCVNCENLVEGRAHRWTAGAFCDDCIHIRSSGETELLDYIRSILPDREVLSNKRFRVDGRGYEADIYIHELQLGIEYNGDYWHSNKLLMKVANENAIERHTRKIDALKTVDVHLISVWERDWNRSRTTMEQILYNFIHHNIWSDELMKLEGPLDRPDLYPA